MTDWSCHAVCMNGCLWREGVMHGEETMWWLRVEMDRGMRA